MQHRYRYLVYVAAVSSTLILLVPCVRAEESPPRPVKELYTKQEYRIPMRDGVHLFTTVYVPRDAGPDRRYPILMTRTPYSVRPYGPDRYPARLGPNRRMQQEGYIFVYQDVRGCYMSEGTFVNMRPHVPNKTSPQDVDESSDTYDTIEWLLANLPYHNGRVGMWGISYPGFYAAAGMIDAHPALKAVSPQAPIADWWYDDFHHHGAFFLPHAFNFLSAFGQSRPLLTTFSPLRFEHPTEDGYDFFLRIGSLKNVNEKYFRDRIPFWNDIILHPNYDEFWQARNLLPHLKRVAPAVLTVGGWFDAEDLYGPLNIYRTIEEREGNCDNRLVMGPWAHGDWARVPGDHLGSMDFESPTSEFYQEWIETVFFRSYLKGAGEPGLPEACMFETGGNRWRFFAQWPPARTQEGQLYLQPSGQLAWEPPPESAVAFTEFVSDPHKPVPFTERISPAMVREYMVDDQRFASRRPDVLVFSTPPLEEDLVVAGPLTAELWVATSQQDADWIVKLIDVFPDQAPYSRFVEAGRSLSGYQMLVRSEVLRGRFREDPARPKPFVPGEVTRVRIPLQDVLHRFRRGHRLMIHIQSSWFPLVDRNPQKWVDNIYLADDQDFTAAQHRVYHSRMYPSRLEFRIEK
ncbi:MAG: glutaryl-7-ACA acylase [Pirellulaceae bacterium]|nr:MAG: glutaryl-7-ACA acylase [Pirellulaceae bacterium]